MNRRILAAAALAAGLTAAAGALPVYVNIAPPAPKVEVRVVAPGPGYVWTGGYYAWRKGVYVWVPGARALPPRPHAVWVPATGRARRTAGIGKPATGVHPARRENAASEPGPTVPRAGLRGEATHGSTRPGYQRGARPSPAGRGMSRRGSGVVFP